MPRIHKFYGVNMTKYIIRRYLSGDAEGGRKTAGIILSLMGIGFNLLLFVLKSLAGTLSGSIAITADGFNNLADSGSCILALLGFKLGDMKPCRSYPFGYGRIEYLSGLLISAAILILGIRMMLSSVLKILHPEAVNGKPVVILILFISIAVKGYMYRYNKHIGSRISSAGMKAAALDSLSDCFATLAILLSIAIERLTGINIDGYAGVMVAMCIIYAGVISAKDSLRPLLGRASDDDTMAKLCDIICEHTDICMLSGITLHDYGPERKLATMYLRRSDNTDSLITTLSKRIRSELDIEAFIMPVDKDFEKEQYKAPLRRQEYNQMIRAQEREQIEY